MLSNNERLGTPEHRRLDNWSRVRGMEVRSSPYSLAASINLTVDAIRGTTSCYCAPRSQSSIENACRSVHRFDCLTCGYSEESIESADDRERIGARHGTL